MPHADGNHMRIGKPLLLTSTTIGLAAGIYEGWHLTGRLMWLFLVPILLFGAGIAWIIRVARRESGAPRTPADRN